MKRRSRTGREASKTRRRKALKTKRRDASKTVSLSAPIPADPEVARLTRELSEALERQAATSEVLQIISESPGDLQPVLTSMLENAVRICGATFGNIYRWDGEALHMLASHNTPPAFAEDRRRSPYRPYPKSPVGRMLVTKRLVHISDVMAEDVYTKKLDRVAVTAVTLGGIRTLLGVPLLNKGEMIGVFFLSRQEVRPFTDKQIGLVENFAAQAVVAIENTRSLNELRQSLERQTATSEVLQVISASPGDLEPVFASVLENAVRICDAKFGSINRWDGEALHLVATHKLPPAFAEFRRRTPFRPGPENPISRMLMTKTIIHFHDLAAEQGYIERDPTFVAAVELGGVRTFLAVPMLKENELIGVVIVYRQEVRPFTDKQIDLVKNFAAQAVIAIENARLLNELRQRTDDLSQRTTDLTESLEQQTATSEVLQVISSSPGDVQPVFEAMLEKAVRICDAKFGSLYLHENGRLRLVAAHGVPEFFEARRGVAFEPAPGSPLDEAMKKKRTTQIADLAATEPYRERHPGMVDAVELAGIRTGVDVPMLKEDELIGILAIHRREVLPFTEKQIELLTNFAAQAVIAIENARLLKELRERTKEVEAQSQELLKLNEQLEQRVADQVGEIERMGRLRRFLPPQVADLIVASGTEKQLESHRREITALFCDLRGFTGFTESADAEDVMALLREYHAAIGEIIIKYSGTLERYAGDGVMVVFNDPIPVDNPALQAVQMALEMRGAISELTEKWRQLGHEIGFGIGIAHGYATLGTIGFEGRFDYAAIGTVSNVASRLCDEARPGQILISPRVLMAVRDAVTVEAVGEFELKGIRRPIAAYNVVAALPPSP
jgi:GAF domain-containing protein